MLALFLTLIAIAVAAVGYAVSVSVNRSPMKLRRKVVVQTTEEYAVRGIIVDRDRRTVTIGDAAVHAPEAGQVPYPVDGQIVVDRDRILWIQVL